MDKKALGKRVNKARKDRGITGEKLAEACHINATYLRQIECGVKIPSLPVFVTICKELAVSPNSLLADEIPAASSQDIEALVGLCSTATPSQLRTITAMIRGAIESINE